MSYENYIKRIRERDSNLFNYHRKHPEISQEKLGKIFKVSQSRISRILRRDNGNGEKGL